MAMPGVTGQNDVTIENAHTVGDFPTIFHRVYVLLDPIQGEVDRNA